MRHMNGHVVSTGNVKHRCSPGWRDEQTEDGTWHGVMPTPWEYPKGTVWECECGRRWISRGAIYRNEPGGCYWRREPWWSRAWRASRR